MTERAGFSTRRAQPPAPVARLARASVGRSLFSAPFLLAILLATLPATLGATTTSTALSEPPTTWTLVPQWSPQSQFAGYYVALEKGFYKKKGLNVRILRGGPKSDPLTMVGQGRADFVTFFLADGISGRAAGTPLVHLTQIVNRSNLMIVAWRDQGIETLEDLDGKRFSFWQGNFSHTCRLLMESRNIEPVRLPQYYSINLFLRRGVAACSAMEYNEYHMVYQAGVDFEELTAFHMKDYAFGFPEDGIYCLEETFRRWPEQCRAFAEASIEGWLWAADHQEETLDIVMKRVRAAHMPTNRPHMRWMLKTVLPSIIPSKGDPWRLGELRRSEYEKTAKALKDYGLLATPPSFEAFRGEGGKAP